MKNEQELKRLQAQHDREKERELAAKQHEKELRQEYDKRHSKHNLTLSKMKRECETARTKCMDFKVRFIIDSPTEKKELEEYRDAKCSEYSNQREYLEKIEEAETARQYKLNYRVSLIDRA